MSAGPPRAASYNINHPLNLDFTIILNKQLWIYSIFCSMLKSFNASGMKNQASQEPVRSQEQRLQHLLQESLSKTQLAFRPGGTGIHRPCWHLQFFITLWVCFLTSGSRVLLWHCTEVRGSTV